MSTTDNTPIEHQNVPVAHQGLHSFLYNSDAEHATTNTSGKTELAFNGEEILPIDVWCDRLNNISTTKIAGVYAVFDRDRNIQYVGYSRNILLSFNSHLTQVGSQICAFAKIKNFAYPKRTEMESLKQEWIAASGTMPPGNGEASQLWAGTVRAAAAAAMTEAERSAYEEKKLKMRKAMADQTIAQELETAQADRDTEKIERHQKLEAAVKNDDWSAAIDQS